MTEAVTYKLDLDDWAKKIREHVDEPTSVRETTTTTGTGPLTLGGAVSGFAATSEVYAPGDVFQGAVTNGQAWEYGYYTFKSGTVVRSLIEGSSNNGAAVNWPAGTKLFIANVADAREALELLLFGYLGAAAFLGAPIPMASGGSAANLTPSLGGMVYSGSSALAILAGTATAGQMLRSGAGAAPAWSTTTWPATVTVQHVLHATATNTIGGSANFVYSDTPTPALVINGVIKGGQQGVADSAAWFIASGITRAIRFGTNNVGGLVEGVDQTGTGSYQPLFVGGSEIRFTNSGTANARCSNAKWYFGGNTDASSKVQIAAGSSTANTAPLQFTSGTVETTARAGVMEYDGTLKFTDAGAVRKTVAFLQSPVFTGRVDVPSYTVATLPAVGAAGGMVFVTDAAVAACLAISNATNWKRCDNMATTVV